MRIKVKLLMLLLVVAYNFSFAQSKNNLDILKKYALFRCLTNNYVKVDSSFISHDYTASYIFQIKTIDNTLLEKVDNYVEENASKYYRNGVVENLNDHKANYIFWYCMDFYESKELDRFIRKIVAAQEKNKTSKRKK